MVRLIPPRLETGRHPRCSGSYGPKVVEWCSYRPGMHMRPTSGLRPWQCHALDRALEHDEEGRLLWSTVIVSAPRQVGKSFLERVVCSWRMHSASIFGEPQDVLHLAHKLTAAQEVWRPAARFETVDGASVRWANGEQKIELDDGSRWMIQAANDGAGVAFSLSMVLVDEAWRVPRHVVDAAVGPTMAESEQPQLWLVSTAGTAGSDLMLSYRALAMASLDPDELASVLLIEWSAPPDEELDIDDPRVWRAASPHWDDRRKERVRQARERSDEWQFRQQWLNQWVPAMARPLFDAEAWSSNALEGVLPDGPISFGVDITADRARAAIVAVVGGVAELVEDRPGAGWVLPRLRELVRSWRPVGIGVDVSGPAATVADELRSDEEIEPLVVELSGREIATASGIVFDAIAQGSLVGMRGSDGLAAAVLSARRRNYGQTWTFARGAPHGVVMLALTTAVWAADHAPVIEEASAIW